MASRIDLIGQYHSLAAQIRRNEATKIRIMRLQAENNALRHQLTMMRVQMQQMTREILTMRHTVVRTRSPGSLGGAPARAPATEETED
ncbi:hypothetical protein MKX08_009263 [Trichoderma sp. CBMAI-0020]|nr:hypothetical protein MKX08_009263 [Trichoderma sp. CBMAI-0020]